MYRIFDALAHPDLVPEGEAKGIDNLAESLAANDFAGACAVGLPRRGGYVHEAYFRAVKKYPHLYPVAGFDFSAGVESEMKTIREIGFRAAKFHPSFSSDQAVTVKSLSDFFVQCDRYDMTAFVCTYNFLQFGMMAAGGFFETFVQAMRSTPKLKVVVSHAGAVDLLRYIELARANQNLLLDLSFTILKYEGSSIDRDIEFAFNRFDRRICVGTDYPEFGHAQLKERFDLFARGLAAEKVRNVAYQNIVNFLDLDAGKF